MERRELLERLAPLIPPPRAHQVRYHGVLAPCASGRDQVVPAGPEVLATLLTSREADGGSTGAGLPIDSLADRSESLPRRIAWADLLKRVFEVDALRCPGCGGRMRLLAAITDPSVARQILECLALPPRAPPLAPARQARKQPAIGSESISSEVEEPQTGPGFDFDQSTTEDRSPNGAS